MYNIPIILHTLCITLNYFDDHIITVYLFHSSSFCHTVFIISDVNYNLCKSGTLFQVSYIIHEIFMDTYIIPVYLC